MRFKQVYQKDYMLMLNFPDQQDQNTEISFNLTGDMWQLDVRILTWHPVLAHFGMEPLFRLERLGARYHSIEDEQRFPRTLYNLVTPGFQDGYWLRLLTFSEGSLINSYFGSAVYAPMSDEAIYGVYLTKTGTELKPLNEPARKALLHW